MKCEKLFETIDGLNDEYIQFLKDVCNIESPTEYKEGVDNVGRYFIEKAKAKGWLVETQHQEISGDVVCITMNADAKGEPVCFSGHMDTVHPVGSFGNPAVTWDDEKIYAPGITDCKGGVVAGFMAMDALEKCGFTHRPVKLILQSDEENGSRNSNKTTVQYMGEKAKGCVAFLNAEPGNDKGFAIEMKGICKFKFNVTGVSVHSSHCPEGASAIAEAAHKILKLEQYKDVDGITCNCGIISGGTAENTVPESCMFTADFRFSTEAEKDKIMEIVKEVASTSFVEGTTCEYTLASSRYAMEKTQRNVELFEKVKSIFQENGVEGGVEMLKNFGGADSADMTKMGIPCIDSFGVHGGLIHNPGEFMYINSLAHTAKKLASVAYCI